jgi:hypothetical protein
MSSWAIFTIIRSSLIYYGLSLEPTPSSIKRRFNSKLRMINRNLSFLQMKLISPNRN